MTSLRGVGPDRTNNHDVFGRTSQPHNMHVIADPDIQLVSSGFKQQCIAVFGKLILGIHLAGMKRIDQCLNFLHVHRRIEHKCIFPKKSLSAPGGNCLYISRQCNTNVPVVEGLGDPDIYSQKNQQQIDIYKFGFQTFKFL